MGGGGFSAPTSWSTRWPISAPASVRARKRWRPNAGCSLAEKEGVEIAQGDFLSHVFVRKEAGDHLLHAMLQPLPASQELLGKFRREGRLDLGTAHVERRGALGCVFFNNLRHLNAEDDTTVGPLETAVDLVLLDPDIQAGLLRGNPVTHSEIPRPADLFLRAQPDPPLSREAPAAFLRDQGFGVRRQALPGAGRRRVRPRRARGHPGETLDRGRGGVRHRWRLPTAPGRGLRDRGSGVLLQPPGPERGDRPWRGAHSAPALCGGAGDPGRDPVRQDLHRRVPGRAIPCQ